MTGWQIVSVISSFAVALVAIFIFTFNKISGGSEWRGKVDSDRDAFKKFIEEMRTDIREIRADIKRIFQILPPATATTQSPLRLTDLGKEISEFIEARAWASELAKQLTNEAEGKDAYEIQELARNRCNRNMDMSELRAALCRRAAFQHGLKLDQVFGVLGIELRNILLRKANLTAPE